MFEPSSTGMDIPEMAVLAFDNIVHYVKSVLAWGQSGLGTLVFCLLIAIKQETTFLLH